MKPQSLIYVFQHEKKYTRFKKKQYFLVSYNHHRRNYYDSTIISILCILSWYIYLLYYQFSILVQSASNCFCVTKRKSCSKQWPPILWISSVIIIVNENKFSFPIWQCSQLKAHYQIRFKLLLTQSKQKRYHYTGWTIFVHICQNHQTLELAQSKFSHESSAFYSIPLMSSLCVSTLFPYSILYIFLE